MHCHRLPGKLAQQRRLAAPGLGGDKDHPALAGQGAIQEAVQARQLALAGDKAGTALGGPGRFLDRAIQERGEPDLEFERRRLAIQDPVELAQLLALQVHLPPLQVELLALQVELQVLPGAHLGQGILHAGQHPAELAELAAQVGQAAGQGLLDLGARRTHRRFDTVDRLQQPARVRPQSHRRLAAGLPLRLQVALKERLYLWSWKEFVCRQSLGKTGHKALQRIRAQRIQDPQAALQRAGFGIHVPQEHRQQGSRHQGDAHGRGLEDGHLPAALVDGLADRLARQGARGWELVPGELGMVQLVELLGRADVLEQVLAQVQQRGLGRQGRDLRHLGCE